MTSPLPETRPARPSVLVVDDEEVVSAFIEETLREEGFDVTVAASGEAALAQLGEQRFDLVVAERNLPDLSGLEFLERARLAVPGVPVVLVAAYGSPDSALEALRAGAADYILKPADDLASFVAQLRKALLGSEARGGSPQRLAAFDARTLPAGSREALKVLRQSIGA